MDSSADEATRKLNEWFNGMVKESPALRNMFGGGASYTYYEASNPRNKSRAKDRYFYTKNKVNHKGNTRFVSGIYRYNASFKRWKAIKEAGHAKKKDAIARAMKLSNNNA